MQILGSTRPRRIPAKPSNGVRWSNSGFDIEKEAIQMQSNDDILEKDWKHLRSKVREHWHSLTDEDIDIINGSRSVLVSMLEENALRQGDCRRRGQTLSGRDYSERATHARHTRLSLGRGSKRWSNRWLMLT
jgi:uncharacterized protein YjbJ (UPF0337 family)